MAQAARRRFYREAAAVAAADGGFRVELDGRPLRTPAGRPFAVPTVALAQAIAAEWAAQGDDILPASMPMTQLAYTALDRVVPDRDAVAALVVKYGETDLLCYRAEGPAELVARQARAWQPLLDWARDRHGVDLAVTEGVTPVAQPDAAAARLAAAVAALDDMALTALAAVVQASGSAVVGLAVLAGRLDGAAAFEVSQLDESHQIDRWGEDAEAMARRALLKSDLEAAVRFLELVA
ncbi:MAG: ATPase [Hyphomicrobiales bacterium]|nr:ATPase [Hyphomicrobiales bacterium]MCP5373922.1 ATPase [Hyphomicrobiales bacterium]